ncbi:MAG TPA: CRTAC1 family protein, partial [Isosphaeraceae bacterium]|nr:CRTAC1 family protein [Isosphaeraceae bacterium]
GASPAFVDDADAAGLGFTFDNGIDPLRQLPETMSGGVGVLDFDGDGWLDVYCVQGGPFLPDPGKPTGGDRLFRNKRDGTFEDATERSGIAAMTRGYGHGVAVGDFDNDGRPDLFITRWDAYALYRNKGDGRFEDATAKAGLDGPRDWPTSAAFADLDGDGDLDLYVAHYLVWDVANPQICLDPKGQHPVFCGPPKFRSRPDHLFRNDGGRFVDVTAEAGIVDTHGQGLGVLASDLDGDGKVDIFVSNDQSANFLFRNRGGMRFEEVGEVSGVGSSSDGQYKANMGIACGDQDGDGRPDLAVTEFYNEGTTLYRNLGDGAFADHSAGAGLLVATRYLLGFGTAFLDFDADGYLDLATTNGHVDDFRPAEPYMMPSQLLAGTPKGKLVDVTAGAGAAWQVPRLGRGLAAADLDNDGRVDLLVLAQNQPLAYHHNKTEGGHRLTIRLEGTTSNRDAVGARVVVTAGGRARTAWRFGGGSYQSASDPRLHFGLSRIDRAERIEVT